MLHKLLATVKRSTVAATRQGGPLHPLHHAHGIDICDDPGSGFGTLKR